MFRGFFLRKCVWTLGILCALLALQRDAATQQSDLFGEVSNPEQASDDPFADNPTQESTGQDDVHKTAPFPANLKIVLGSGQRVVEGGMISSRGLITQPPAVREANDRIDSALDQPLKLPIDYIEIPLIQIMQAISDDYDIPIVFDRQAFEALAISEETEVTVNLRNVSLRTAIELMLRQVEDLTYLATNEVLMITSEDEAQQRPEVRVYRVDDLIRVPYTGELDFDSLIDTVVSSVEHDSWMENGTGEGEVQPYYPGMLVITQTRRVHQQIESLFSTMREVKSAIEADSPADDQERVGSVQTKAFRIQNVWGDDPEQGREILTEAIGKSVAWEQEGIDEDDTFLAVMPDRVIARHTLAVLRQVEETLKQLDYIKTRGGGYGGGAGAEAKGGGFFNVEDAPTK